MNDKSCMYCGKMIEDDNDNDVFHFKDGLIHRICGVKGMNDIILETSPDPVYDFILWDENRSELERQDFVEAFRLINQGRNIEVAGIGRWENKTYTAIPAVANNKRNLVGFLDLFSGRWDQDSRYILLVVVYEKYFRIYDLTLCEVEWGITREYEPVSSIDYFVEEYVRGVLKRRGINL